MREKILLKNHSKKIIPLAKLIGKPVKVLGGYGWVGKVTGVVDEENVLVSKNGEPVEVSIFDVRSI